MGVACVLGGTLASAIGTGLIARSGKAGWVRWGVGNFLIVIVGSSLQVASFAYIPQSESSAMGGLEAMWIQVIARCAYREPVPPRDWAATLAVVCGCAIVATAAPAMVAPDEDQMPHVTLLVGGYVAVFVLASASNLSSGRDHPKKNPLPLVACAAIMGGFTDTFAKAWDFSGDRIWGAGSLVFAAAQLCIMNAALARFGERAVQPAYKTALSVSAIAVGGAAFSEFDGIRPPAALAFFLGTAVSVGGAMFLAIRKHAAAPPSPQNPHPKSRPPPVSALAPFSSSTSAAAARPPSPTPPAAQGGGARAAASSRTP